MSNSGIIRKIDNLGRIVLPKELRYALNINSGDDFEIYINGEEIILKKYSKVSNYKEEIINMLNVFNMNIKFKIYLIVNNKNLGYDEKINNEIIKLITERKIIRNVNCNLSDKISINGNSILYPIVENGDLIATIIAIGSENIDNMENIVKIFSNLIKNKIVE